jgi:hypothetical protein
VVKLDSFRSPHQIFACRTLDIYGYSWMISEENHQQKSGRISMTQLSQSILCILLKLKTIYSTTIFLPGDFPCSSCSPGTVSLEDKGCARSWGSPWSARGALRKPLGSWGRWRQGVWGPGLGCGGPRHEENHGEFGGDSMVSRKLKDLKGKS